MAKFKDASGREWSLDIRLADLKRVREATGVDLAALAKSPEKFVRTMLLDAHELASVVWCLCRPRAARSLGMAVPDADATAEADFLDALDADALAAAVEALWEAFADFFRWSPIGLKIRQDGAAKAMAAVQAAITGEDDTPAAVTTTEPTPAPADPPAVAAA